MQITPSVIKGLELNTSVLVKSPSYRRKSDRRKTVTEVLINSFQERSLIIDKSPTAKNMYSNLNCGIKRINYAYRLFYNNIICVYGNNETVIDLNTEIIEAFFFKHTTNGLSKEEIDNLKNMIIVNLIDERKGVDRFKFVSIFIKAILGYIDITLDILTLLQYINKGYILIAAVQIASLLISTACQMVTSLLFGQPFLMGLSGLIGLKPIIEAWRNATDAKPFKNQKLTNAQMLWLSHAVEMIFETIPQSFIQMVALLIMEKNDISTIQYISLFVTFVSAGTSCSLSDRSLDINQHMRQCDPYINGYVPINGSFIQLIAMVLFISFYMIMKVFAVSLNIVVGNSVAIMCWLLFEMTILLGIRMYYKNWRFYKDGADGIIFSLITHFFIYISMMTVPFPALRNPTFLTYRVYCGVIIYSIISNYVFVLVPYSFFWETSYIIHEYTAFGMLITTTVLSVLSASVAYYYIPKALKNSTYKYNTFSDYLSSYHWNESTICLYKNIEYETQDAIRATIPIRYSFYYIPVFKLIRFYADNWDKWEKDPPEWFDDDFKNNIPIELLVGVRSMNLDTEEI